MADQTQVLRALSTKTEAASPKQLSDELKITQDKVRTYLNRLKDKDLVEGGASEWFITDEGRAYLQKGKNVYVSKEDAGVDELSRFKYFGQLAGVEPELIQCGAEIFQNADMRSIDEFDRVMAGTSIPVTNRNRWRTLYLDFLRLTTPKEKRDELYPLPKPGATVASGDGTTSGGERKSRADALDYVVEGNEILRAGDDLGMFTFREALQVVAAKRGTEAGAGPLSGLKELADAFKTLNPNQPITVKDILDIADKFKPSGGGAGNPPPGPSTYVDEEGNVKELPPGKPLVITKVIQQPGKTYLLEQTAQGIVKREYDPGSPIIINSPASPPAPGGGMPPMVPFPVFGADGQPVYDKDGKPVYANLDPMLRWLGFQGEQRRADEKHQALMGLAQTVRENVGDGIQAIKMLASQIKQGGTAAAPKSETPQGPQAYECGACKTKFTIPATDGWEQVKCPNPNCGRTWSRQEVLGS